MSDQSVVFERGGKLEINQILEADPVLESYIPRSRYITSEELANVDFKSSDDESIKFALKMIGDLHYPIIARGSIEGDESILIDVLPTYQLITDEYELGNAIRNIFQKAQDPKFTQYLEYMGKSHALPNILIQEQAPSTITGSMIRHPHTRELIIQYSDKEPEYDTEVMSSATLDSKGNLSHFDNITNKSRKITEDSLRELMDVFTYIESLEILGSEVSLQMEFSLDPVNVFQLRVFKNIQEVGTFDLPPYNPDQDYIYSGISFGVTPESGIELPFYYIEYSIKAHLPDLDTSKPFGVIFADKHHQPSWYDLMQLGRNLKAVCLASEEHDFLEHGDYRALKLIEYSLLGRGEASREIWRSDDGPTFATLFSNGEAAKLIPMKEA